MSFEDFDINELGIDYAADSEQSEEPAGELSDSEDKNKKPDQGRGMELYDWLQCIVAALVCGILIFMFIARSISVVGSSMYPTLIGGSSPIDKKGDRIITSNLFYTPKNGDIIVFQTASYSDEPLVKRVIATAGQTVDIDFEEGVVYVDGEALDEPYTASPTFLREDFAGEVTVPEGCVFVMGDNRNHSTDSRTASIGMVDRRCIIGKVLFIIIPGENETDAREWKRIGSVYGS